MFSIPHAFRAGLVFARREAKRYLLLEEEAEEDKGGGGGGGRESWRQRQEGQVTGSASLGSIQNMRPALLFQYASRRAQAYPRHTTTARSVCRKAHGRLLQAVYRTSRFGRQRPG